MHLKRVTVSSSIEGWMGKPVVLSRNREEELLNRFTVGEKGEIGNRISSDSQNSDLAQWMIVSLTK